MHFESRSKAGSKISIVHLSSLQYISSSIGLENFLENPNLKIFAFDIPTKNTTTVYIPIWTGFGQDFGCFLELYTTSGY